MKFVFIYTLLKEYWIFRKNILSTIMAHLCFWPKKNFLFYWGLKSNSYWWHACSLEFDNIKLEFSAHSFSTDKLFACMYIRATNLVIITRLVIELLTYFICYICLNHFVLWKQRLLFFCFVFLQCKYKGCILHEAFKLILTCLIFGLWPSSLSRIYISISKFESLNREELNIEKCSSYCPELIPLNVEKDNCSWFPLKLWGIRYIWVEEFYF